MLGSKPRSLAVTLMAFVQCACGQTDPAGAPDRIPNDMPLNTSGARAATSGGASASGSAGATSGSSAGGAAAGGTASEAGGSSGAGAGGGSGGSAESCAKWMAGSGPASAWVYVDAAGALAYKTVEERGDRILDFSFAGYRGGGVALPRVAVKRRVQPSGGDDTNAIQDALDAVAQLPLIDGTRGAVELSAGTFSLKGSLRITTSGVVLRGAGSSADGTLLKVEGSPRTLITLSGSGQRTTSGRAVPITDRYVPAGSQSLHVDRTADLTVGDDVLVQRPITESWVHFMGMDTLVRNGAPQTWLSRVRARRTNGESPQSKVTKLRSSPGCPTRSTPSTSTHPQRRSLASRTRDASPKSASKPFA